jgi:hypothetical protein
MAIRDFLTRLAERKLGQEGTNIQPPSFSMPGVELEQPDVLQRPIGPEQEPTGPTFPDYQFPSEQKPFQLPKIPRRETLKLGRLGSDIGDIIARREPDSSYWDDLLKEERLRPEREAALKIKARGKAGKPQTEKKNVRLAAQGLVSTKHLQTWIDSLGDADWVQVQKALAGAKAGIFATEQGRLVRGKMRNAIDVILRNRTGARINQDEFDQAMEAWGLKLGDTRNVVKAKLKDLELMYKLMAGTIAPFKTGPDGQLTPELTPEYEAAVNATNGFIQKTKKYQVPVKDQERQQTDTDIEKDVKGLSDKELLRQLGR